MAVEREIGVATENEETEKPVREQLKKASISRAAGDATMTGEETIQSEKNGEENGDSAEPGEPAGRLQKKRSFEDFQSEQHQETSAPPTRHHTRKRSRDSTAEEEELNNGMRVSGERSRDLTDGEQTTTSNGHPKAPTSDRPRTPEQTGEKRGEAAVEEMASPKIKRSRLHPSTEENGATSTTEKTSAPAELSTEEKSELKLPPPSGFANTSAASPFSSLGRSKSPSTEPPQTSASAFAASGFGSLAGSNSGFGAVGKTSGGFGTGGSFATKPTSTPPASATENENDKAKPSLGSAFGGALGQQSSFATAGSSSGGFGSRAGGFSTLGSGSAFGGGGFGSLGGGGLSSFASGKPSPSLSGPSKLGKAFGAPPDEDEEAPEEGGEGDDEAGFKSPLSQESDKQDERFYEQSLETGEEDETTEYSCRAKLYNFVVGAEGKKEWKERGLGTIRLNLKKHASGETDTTPKARLLMRAEGSHKVILNTSVKKEIKFGAPAGGPPQGGYVYFMGAVDGKEKLEMLQLKVRQQFAVELHTKIVDLQALM